MAITQQKKQDSMIAVKFKLNGAGFAKTVPANWTLLRFLRDELGYTGTKCGCEVGECGACTVLLNNQAVNSCLVLASQINDANIWTIEGVANSEKLHPIQQAFLECDAVHCGFCSTGMVMSTLALLLENANPSDNEIKSALAGNLCRCTGYIQVLEAVKLSISLVNEKDLERFRK